MDTGSGRVPAGRGVRCRGHGGRRSSLSAACTVGLVADRRRLGGIHADVIWGVYGILDRDDPSVADAFYLGRTRSWWPGWPSRSRAGGRSASTCALLDAGLLTVIAGLLAWVFIIQPVLTDPDVPQFDSIVLIAYPLADLAPLAVAARFVMGSSWNVPSLRLWSPASR